MSESDNFFEKLPSSIASSASVLIGFILLLFGFWFKAPGAWEPEERVPIIVGGFSLISFSVSLLITLFPKRAGIMRMRLAWFFLATGIIGLLGFVFFSGKML